MLVDTNVVSELMRPVPEPRVSAWAATQTRFELSVVSLEEILYGLSLRKSARLARWFDAFVVEHCDVLPISVGIARRCAELRASLRAKGRTRIQADMLIAATAAEHDLVVVTRNERDFSGCGIRVLNPFARA
jgi:predicted nucleic acid-binding protein